MVCHPSYGYSSWKIAFTRHDGFLDDTTITLLYPDLFTPHVSRSINSSASLPIVTKIFVSTFRPFEFTYLEQHFPIVPITVFIEEEGDPFLTTNSCSGCQKQWELDEVPFEWKTDQADHWRSTQYWKGSNATASVWQDETIWICNDCDEDVLLCDSCHQNELILSHHPPTHQFVTVMSSFISGLTMTLPATTDPTHSTKNTSQYDHRATQRVENTVLKATSRSCRICDHTLSDESTNTHCDHEQRKVTWLFPRRPNTFCVHPKLSLIELTTGYLRVVISSFNLSFTQEINAGDTFWWVDVPLKSTTSVNGRCTSRFERELSTFVREMGIYHVTEWLETITAYDFTNVDRDDIHLISSVPGLYQQKKRAKYATTVYGLHRLHNLLSKMPQFESHDHQIPRVDVQVWSMGGSHYFWYQKMARVMLQPRHRSTNRMNLLKHLRFIFENGSNYDERMITRRRIFYDATNPLFLRNKTTYVSELNKCLIRSKEDTNEEESEVVEEILNIATWGWHSKDMIRTYAQGTCQSGCTKLHGWRYTGSHNLSAASWGAEVPGNGDTSLKIRNWEVGVLIRSMPCRPGDTDTCNGRVDLTHVPLPFNRSTLVNYPPSSIFAHSFGCMECRGLIVHYDVYKQILYVRPKVPPFANDDNDLPLSYKVLKMSLPPLMTDYPNPIDLVNECMVVFEQSERYGIVWVREATILKSMSRVLA